MKTLKERIDSLRQQIIAARQGAQYAEGRAYREEMRKVDEMQVKLNRLERELKNAGTN